MDFVIPTDHGLKTNENEKRNKYLDVTRQLRKLWNIWVTVIPIGNDVLGTASKGSVTSLEELEIGRRFETVQIIELLRSARNSRKSPGDPRTLAVTLF